MCSSHKAENVKNVARRVILYILAISAAVTSSSLGRIDLGISSIGIRFLVVGGSIGILAYFTIGILYSIIFADGFKLMAPLILSTGAVAVVGAFHVVTATNIEMAISRYPRLLFGFGIMYFLINLDFSDREIRNAVIIFVLVFSLQVLYGNLEILFTPETRLSLFAARRRTATAHLIIFSLPMSVGLLVHSRKLKEYLIYGASSGILLIGVFLTYQRGAWVATFVGLLVFGWIQLRRNNISKPVFIMGLSSLAILFGVVILLSPSLWERFMTLFSFDPSEASNYTRFYLLLSGLELVFERPIIGLGYDFIVEFKSTSFYENFYTGAEFVNSHNTLITAINEYGIFGLLLILSLLRKIVRGLGSKLDSMISRQLSDMFILFILMTGIYQAVTVMYYNPVFWFVLSLGLAHIFNHTSPGLTFIFTDIRKK